MSNDVKKNTEDTEEKKIALEKEDQQQVNTEEPKADEKNDTVTTEENTEKEEADKDKSESKTDKKEETKKPEKTNKKDDKKSAVKEAKKKERKSRRELKARAFRRGWFSVVLVVLFIAAMVVLNFIAITLNEKLPALTIDTTGTESFELTKNTVEYLPSLKDKINIIVLADEKEYKEGGEYYIQANSLLHEYANKSDKITLEYVDMASNPTFSSKYPNETLSYYGIIVESEKGYKYLKESDLFDIQMNYLTSLATSSARSS